MENNKMMKTAGTFETIFKVVRGITKACGFVCLVMAVLTLIFGEKMFDSGALTLDLDFVKLHLAEDFQVVTGAVQLYTVVCLLVGSVLCFVVAYTCGLYRGILALVKEGRPFDGEVPAGLRKLAWVCLVGGGLIQLLGIASRILLVNALPMDVIFSSPAIESVEYVYMFDFGFVWMFVVMILLARIFEYGQKLQQESDETL